MDEDKSGEETEGAGHLDDITAASSGDDSCPPMMHWEELNQRIAELEEQEARSKETAGMREHLCGVWGDDREDYRKCGVSLVSSRFVNKKLQLCFVNNEDEEDEERSVSSSAVIEVSAGTNRSVGGGLKQEVVTALRTHRDKLLAEEKKKCVLAVSRRKLMDLQELQCNSVLQLKSLKDALQQEIYALSSELVGQLEVRDQLRTKQDAMLLDVQDLTCD